MTRYLPLLWLILLTVSGCVQNAPGGLASWNVSSPPLTVAARGTPTRTPFLPATRAPGTPIVSPTPDAPHAVPSLPSEEKSYVVQPGDTLAIIAGRFGVPIQSLIAANDLTNPDWLAVGQTLRIPAVQPAEMAPGDKIIPDSELVYGPVSITLDVEDFVAAHDGYLARYQQEVEDLGGGVFSGAQIVQRVARQYSVNPRLLLALLEYRAGWVTDVHPDEATLTFPLGVRDVWRSGLYRQLAWAANQLNRGYYLWKVDAVASWILADGSVVPVNPLVNPGTAAVQQLFALLDGRRDWERAVSPAGLAATYQALFGYPFDFAIEPLLPPDLRQPEMWLPFEQGVTWAFTGGPHGGWGDGSAWAALDFAPSIEGLGCSQSDWWVTAVADGLIVRAEYGEVVQDLDGDGFEQTGWTVLYMHIEGRDRVRPGVFVQAGDRLGHPSCEGGYSTGTHLHIARRYNGEWIPADQDLPFVMDGWVSRGTGIEYDGFLERDGASIEAWNGATEANAIRR